MDIYSLLRMSPDKALLVMANETHGLSLTPSNSRIIDITPESGNVAVASIEAYYDGSEGLEIPVESDLYTGVLRHRFNRLDLTELFGSPLRIALKPPTNTAAILEVINKSSGIVFDSNDFDVLIVEEDTFEMVPRATSRRWVGTLTIELSE